MTVIANGSEVALTEGAKLPQLIELCGMSLNTAAVWINGRQPLFSEYPDIVLHDGDKVKLYYMCIGG